MTLSIDTEYVSAEYCAECNRVTTIFKDRVPGRWMDVEFETILKSCPAGHIWTDRETEDSQLKAIERAGYFIGPKGTPYVREGSD